MAETGKAVPSLLTLKKVADALHTTISMLVGDAFYINSNIPHHLKNINDKESQVLIAASAPRF